MIAMDDEVMTMVFVVFELEKMIVTTVIDCFLMSSERSFLSRVAKKILRAHAVEIRHVVTYLKEKSIGL